MRLSVATPPSEPMIPGPITAEPNPMDQVLRYRAQSLLHGAYSDRDGRSYAFDAFTVEEAKEIIEWAARNPN